MQALGKATACGETSLPVTVRKVYLEEQLIGQSMGKSGTALRKLPGRCGNLQ